MQKRCPDSHLHEILAKTFEKIDGASNSRIFSEGNQPFIILVCNLLVVDQSDIFLQNGIKGRHSHGHSHIDMRKVKISFVGDEVLGRDLLDSHNQRAIVDILVDNGS